MTVITDNFGFKWSVREGTGDNLPFNGHEDFFVEMCHGRMPMGGTFVDVGAHVGLYTVRMSDKASTLYAIEPHWATTEVLMDNLALNGLNDAKVISAAAWDTNKGTVYLHDMDDHETSGRVHCSDEPDSEFIDRGMVRTITLDALLQKEERVDLIKIDVEGGERNVLWGSREVIKKFKPVLFIEMHDFYVGEDNRRVIEEFLEEVGYAHCSDLPYYYCYYWFAAPK